MSENTADQLPAVQYATLERATILALLEEYVVLSNDELRDNTKDDINKFKTIITSLVDSGKLTTADAVHLDEYLAKYIKINPSIFKWGNKFFNHVIYEEVAELAPASAPACVAELLAHREAGAALEAKCLGACRTHIEAIVKDVIQQYKPLLNPSFVAYVSAALSF